MPALSTFLGSGFIEKIYTSPESGAGDIDIILSSISATFNVPIEAGFGDVYVLDDEDNEVTRYDVSSPDVVISSNSITFPISETLTYNTLYTVFIDAGAILDTASADPRVGQEFSWSFTTEQSPIFVDSSAAGANDGTSWEDAYTDLEDVLSIASSGARIVVAKGTYIPSQGYDVADGTTTESDAREATFRVPDSVEVYGGFAGNELISNSTFQDVLDARDLDVNKTILSGELDDNGDNTDNAYHVVFAYQVTSENHIGWFYDQRRLCSEKWLVSSTINSKVEAGFTIMVMTPPAPLP